MPFTPAECSVVAQVGRRTASLSALTEVSMVLDVVLLEAHGHGDAEREVGDHAEQTILNAANSARECRTHGDRVAQSECHKVRNVVNGQREPVVERAAGDVRLQEDERPGAVCTKCRARKTVLLEQQAQEGEPLRQRAMTVCVRTIASTTYLKAGSMPNSCLTSGCT